VQASAPNQDHHILAKDRNSQQHCQCKVQYLVETITYSLRVGTASNIVSARFSVRFST
jgi:hypothetical protein